MNKICVCSVEDGIICENCRKETFAKEAKNVKDQRVLDFVKGINQLCKDTGLEIKSFDWSEAMIEAPEGNLYFLCKDEDDEEYHIEKEARQTEQDLVNSK